MRISVFTQSSVKIESKQILYFDPYQIKEKYQDADYIFITHDHYDHYDESSIKNIQKESTIIIAPSYLKERVSKLTNNYLLVSPDKKYELASIPFETTFSYNNNKQFHPKERADVGYKIKIENKYLYIMGDTDNIKENQNIKCDICFVPIGGIYTMDVKEAARYINTINPSVAIPIHYGSIVGDINLYKEFINLVNPNIKVEVYIK